MRFPCNTHYRKTVAKNCHISVRNNAIDSNASCERLQSGVHTHRLANPLKTFPAPEQLECVSFRTDKQNSVHLVTDGAITPGSCKQNHEKNRKVGAANLRLSALIEIPRKPIPRGHLTSHFPVFLWRGRP
ncbi:uncharacterized protein CDAR_213011 [Caerostris darwini]|uniref:Uncharacterized protein n=1 Tax=Caerostris darwini TaxID=1538125 RepID=A0AAV4UBK5_9ARAC|nr:uncharacterized protein CDAR_213011 [Caerostris darwini]